jgi:purine-binding chemotaxis protein CheW
MPERDVFQAVSEFLTFRIDGRPYAIPAEGVSEIIRIPPAARVPQAHAALLGVANLRGVVAPLVSLRGLLGVKEADELPHARAIVLSGELVALAVDNVDSFVAIDEGRLEVNQTSMTVGEGEQVLGVFQASFGVTKILDIQSMLDLSFSERGRSREAKQQQLRAPQPKSSSDSKHIGAEMLVTFDVGGQEYALRLNEVQEVVSLPTTFTLTVSAARSVLGMMAYRDQLLPLISLRGLLGFAIAERFDGNEKAIVSCVGGALVGLVADRARAIVAAERDRIDPIPALLSARAGGEARIEGVYREETGQRLISILTPDLLFEENTMRRLGAGSGADAKQNAEQAARVERNFLIFCLGNDQFGMPVEAVDEVARMPEQITRVPKAPRFLEGVINLRGEVLPIVDQRRRFDMPKLERGKSRRLIVVKTEHHRAGVIVDSVLQVMRSYEDQIEATPTLTDEMSRLVTGVINLPDEGRIVLLLDPAELLTRAEQGLLDAFTSRAGRTSL